MRGYANWENFRSMSWRKARAKRMGIKGHISRLKWEKKLARFQYRCAFCFARPERLTLDHKVPLSLGGQHNIKNVQPLCEYCNKLKGNRIFKRITSGRIVCGDWHQEFPVKINVIKLNWLQKFF